MSKLWLVARHEYGVAVRRRTFLLGTFGLPFAVAVVVGLSAIVALNGRDRRPIGYVDLAGLLSSAQAQPDAETAGALRAFTDETAAHAALLAGRIQAFYVVSADYRASGRLLLFYGASPPDGDALAPFESALRAALLVGQPADVRAIVTRGPSLVLRTADGRREISQQNVLGLLLPLLAGAAFTIATLTSANYMIQAVATEKENRMVEVVTTAMTPLQLMGGKSLGLMALALTQLAVWAAMALIAVLVLLAGASGRYQIQIPGELAGVILLFFLPAYALVAGMMTTVGSAVTEVHQGQQIAGTLNLLFLVPLFFFPLLVANPNAPLMVALTLFPTTAFLTISMRWAFTAVPLWQVGLSWVILLASALFAIWAAARVFRVGMLRYGQSLDLGALARILRPATRAAAPESASPQGAPGSRAPR